jgi:regulatory protein YycI of two-component signal transduction system YycFG
MDILRNLFGSVTSGVIRLLVTVGILAAVYFFIVKPVLDTTETISSETNDSIQKSFENSGINDIDVTLENVNKQVERQLQQSLKASKQHGDLDKLRNCMNRAVGNVDKVRYCAKKYGAG